jgi:D-arabinose 5-phosphate isomerase GutQ
MMELVMEINDIPPGGKKSETLEHIKPPPPGRRQDINLWIKKNLNFNIDELPKQVASSFSLESEGDLCEQIGARIKFINDCLEKTIKGSEEKIEEIVNLFSRWMTKHSIVRLIGVGRAKIAGNISMYRLAHGGARIFINDGNIPLPHSIHGGGIIAVSASGKTEIIHKILKHAYNSGKSNMVIVGIAAEDADKEFKDYCHYFIGIKKDAMNNNNSLTALADIEEQIICQLLDAMVVAAGKKELYDDTQWRLGHEDVGATGPYGVEL